MQYFYTGIYGCVYLNRQQISGCLDDLNNKDEKVKIEHCISVIQSK